MFTILYGICLLLCAVAAISMAQKNYNNIDMYHWTIMVLISVIVMAYWLQSQVTTTEAAAFLNCFVYLDSTVMITAVLFSLLHTLGISISSWGKIIGYGLAGIQLAVVCLCVRNDLYYQSVTVVETGMGTSVQTANGPLKLLHAYYLLGLLVCLFLIVLISLRKKGSYSGRNLVISLSLPLGALLLYYLERRLAAPFSLLPVLYTLGDLVIALRYDKAHLHDISFLIAEQHEHNGTRGYVAVGREMQFYCCNEKSLEFLPFLKNQQVNQALPEAVFLGCREKLEQYYRQNDRNE